MRITRDLLLRLAKENTEERAFNTKSIIAAYLSGSLLSPDPLLGGTTDIDLVFVHNTPPALSREIKALSPDIHLDIRHRYEKEYDPPRALRSNPWLGYELYAPQLLYETKHFFEFHQASLRAGFEEPKNLLKRSFSLLNTARKTWMDLQLAANEATPSTILQYLDAIHHAANAIAELTGPPLAERRLLVDLPARAEAINKPELADALLGLLGGIPNSFTFPTTWLAAWEDAYRLASAAPQADLRIHPARQNYYQKAIAGMLASEAPQQALFPLLYTWTLAAQHLPETQISSWKETLTSLNLGGEIFASRLQGLDRFLDTLEELLEKQINEAGFEIAEIV